MDRQGRQETKAKPAHGEPHDRSGCTEAVGGCTDLPMCSARQPSNIRGVNDYGSKFWGLLMQGSKQRYLTHAIPDPNRGRRGTGAEED